MASGAAGGVSTVPTGASLPAGSVAGLTGAANGPDAAPLQLPVLDVGPRRSKRTLKAEKVIESLVVPSYPQTSSSPTTGVLTIVPVLSVEKGLSPKIFVAYKSTGGQSRKLTNQLSPHFGFCTYEWVEYPCSGVDACPNVPRAVVERPHTTLEPGDADQFAVYEKLFASANSEAPEADTAQQALAREWDKYTSVFVPFIHRACPNVICSGLSTPPKGQVVTIRSSGRKFLGCAGYSPTNRMGHKNSSITNIHDLTNIETWIGEGRYVFVCSVCISRRGHGYELSVPHVILIFLSFQKCCYSAPDVCSLLNVTDR